MSDDEQEAIIHAQAEKKHSRTLGASRSLKSAKGLFRGGSRKRRSKRASRKSLKRDERLKLHNTGSSSSEEVFMGALGKGTSKETPKETTAPSLRKSGQHKRVSVDVGDDLGETPTQGKETRGKYSSGTFTSIFREKDKDREKVKEKEKEKEKDLTPSKRSSRHRKHSKNSQRHSLTIEDEH